MEPSLSSVVTAFIASSVLIIVVTAAYLWLVELPERPARPRRKPGRHRRPAAAGLTRRGGMAALSYQPRCSGWRWTA